MLFFFFLFIFFSFLQFFIEVLVHVKDLESYKGQTQQKLLFPTENTAPETPPQ